MRKKEGTGILGVIVLGIMVIFNFIVENWQIICIVLTCIALILFAIKFFRMKQEDNRVFELKRELIEKDNQINKIRATKNEMPINTNKQETKSTKRKQEYKPDKIDLINCQKKDILSIEGFDEEKATQFLTERITGHTWYDAESFAQYFEITQPHQILDIQLRVIFPQKPHTKQGRKVDF